MSRLTKIYTRDGDTGKTGLVGGRRMSKDAVRLWACGTVDELNTKLGPLQEFILPAGCRTAGALHLARTVCRRAERCCVRLASIPSRQARAEKIGDGVLPYLNRLGDALFVLARWANRIRGIRETYWKKP